MLGATYINVNTETKEAWREPGGREKGPAAQKVGLERAGARVEWRTTYL